MDKSKRNIKYNYNYKNIASALAVVLIIVLIITTACHRSSEQKKENIKPKSKVTVSSSKTEGKKNAASKLTKNYKYISMENKKDLGNGTLAIIDSKHGYSYKADDLDTVYSYLFDNEGNQVAFASSSEVTARKDALKSFNKMATDFYKETGLASLLINSAYSESENESENIDENSKNEDSDSSSEKNTNNSSDESITGYVIDLLTYDEATGTYPEFTGEDKYNWIVNNCYKYGFIQTDSQNNPGRFRYIGKVNAEIMHNKNLSFEKYNEFLKKYSFEKPFSFTDDNNDNYLLYYVKNEKSDKTKIPIPQKDDGSEYEYDISGNNVDGYVICVYFDVKEQNDDSSSETDSSDLFSSDEKIEVNEGTSSLDSSETISPVESDESQIYE